MSLKFLNVLSQIPDRRRGQGKKWHLGPVLLATILAIMSGATSYRKVHSFIKAHREHLKDAFGFGWKGIPAYSAIRFVLHGLDGVEVEKVFREHALELSGTEASDDIETSPVVAIDGKTLRHSFDAFNDRNSPLTKLPLDMGCLF